MRAETFLDGRVTQYCGDVLEVLAKLPADHFDCVVTSPPYWGLRDYGTARWEGGDPACDHTDHERWYTENSAASTKGSSEAFSKAGPANAARLKKARWRERGICTKCGALHCDDQLGLERSLGEHIAVMVKVFGEVRRVLKPTGTLWLNYGDCYAASPNGRSAADTKAAGNDDRTFRDKPFSTVGAINGGKLVKWNRRSERNGHNLGGFDESVADYRVMHGGYLKPKDLCMVPNRLAIALQDDGWWVRSEIVWGKKNPMPDSSGRYRPSTAHEKIFMLTKSSKNFYDSEAVALRRTTPANTKKPDNWDTTRGNGGHGSILKTGRAKGEKADKQRGHTRRHAGFNDRWDQMERDEQIANGRLLRNYEPADLEVWAIAPQAFPESHFATFPEELAERCIKAGCPDGGTVLDPFGGAGTTAMVAVSLGRTGALIELNPEYCTLARARIEAAFMGKDEGSRHMIERLGKTADPGPLFGGQA